MFIVDGKLKIDVDTYSTGELSAYGAGSSTGGSGGGLIKYVYDSTDLNGIYNDTDYNNTFNAYTINEIYKTGYSNKNRIIALESGTYNKTETDARIAAVVNSAPSTLDTLNELANALGNDPNFATTTANLIGTKLSLSGGTLTGNLTAPTFIGSLSGNSSTTTKLQTARTIAGISFDGTANIDIPFANLSSKPTTLSGYGITDALLASSYTASDVLTKIKTVDGSGSGLDADLLDGVHYQNILERTESGNSYSGTSTGWFRIASFLLNNGGGQDCILIINRSYNSANNESYKFSISSVYGGGINVTQLSGYANTKLIDKIRIDYVDIGVAYIDLHISVSTNGNHYRWSTIGGATSYTAWTAVSDTPNGTSYEFTTVNGCKSDKGFTGNIVGNASTATKLQTAHTIAGVSFDGSANISIPFANLSSIPTTLAGYGITDAYTTSSADNTFLKLAGGTMTGTLDFSVAGNNVANFKSNGSIGVVTLAGNGTYGTRLDIKNAANTANVIRLNFDGSASFVSNITASNYLRSDGATIWHSGNDGAGSGLDADLLDGLQYVKYLPYGCYNNTLGILVTTEIPATSDAMFVVKIIGNDYSGNPKGIDTTIQFYNYATGNYIINGGGTNHGSSFGDIKIFNYNNKVCIWFQQANNYQTYKILAYTQTTTNYNVVESITNAAMPTTGVTREATITPKQSALITDNVASATKLATTRTIWGQGFDGSGNVSGNMTGVGDISFSSSTSFNLNSTSGSILRWDGANALLSSTAAGSIYLRPNGIGSVTGQMILYPTGNLTVNGTVYSVSNGGSYLFGVRSQNMIGSNTDSDAYFWCTEDDAIRFGTSNSERMRIFANGNVIIGAVTDSGYKLDVNGSLRVTAASTFNSVASLTIGVSNTDQTLGRGISLYNGPTSGKPAYGIMFSGTSTFGTHGSVTGDWATYLTMSDTTNRGWIFQRGSTNVASISGAGDMYLNGLLNIASTLNAGGQITAQNGIVTDYDGSSWLTMATRGNQIRGNINASTTQAHSLYCVKNSNGDAIAFGGLGVNTGFYGFTANTIANNINQTDWYTAWDVSTGMLNHTGSFYTGGYISSNSYIRANSRIFVGYDSSTSNSISCSGWFRSNGATGWINDTYGGGITMTDSTYVTVYNNKAFKVSSTASDSINTDGGVLAAGEIKSNSNITAQGELTAYVASDKRLKKNIKPIDNALNVINKLEAVSYNWNDKAKKLNENKTNQKDFGLIAQDVEDILPEIVHNIHNDKYKAIDYVKLIPFLIKSVQEQQKQIEKLKEQIQNN